MSIRKPASFRALLLFLLVAGFAGIAAIPAPGQEPTRDQKILDLEKQLQEINRKLDELKKAGTPTAAVATTAGLPADWAKSLAWRPIGPATMGGRITALSIFEADPCVYWVATASGGLLKTVNNGNTFEHQFDREATVSIGDVCVAPSNKEIVWVGTGEGNPRNSVSWGDGVYKSTDGGKTWANMGLKNSFQIGRIVVHPTNPDIVYVGALGRLYGASEERGLYKTADGGKTWQSILKVDDKTGVIDLRMSPKDPETLLVATWERQRDGYDSHRGDPPLVDGYDAYDPIKKWGQGGGIYKTSDGGKSFKKLTKGLPTSPLGRIGLDYYRKNGDEVFAIIDCEKIGMGTPPSQVFLGILGEDAPGGAKLTEITADSPAAKAGLKVGDVVKAVDKQEVKGYDPFVEKLHTHKVGDKLALTVLRGKDTLDVVATLEQRPDPAAGNRGTGPGLDFIGEDSPEGVRIVQIFPGGASEKAGLKVGDVVRSIDKQEVKESRRLVEIVREKKVGDKVTLATSREKEAKDVVLTLEPRRGPGGARPNPNRPYGFQYGGQRENVQDQQGPDSFQYGGIYKSTDGGESWTRINSLNPRPMYFSQVRVDPSDDKYLYVLGITLSRSVDGGKTFKPDGGNGVHADQHCLWIDPKDGRHMIVGCDGGFYATYDRMDHWDHLAHMAIGQFYHVAVDARKPYHVYGGLQDNGTWGGPSHALGGIGPVNDDWVAVSGGDGFMCRVDPTDPDIVYFTSQDGNMGRRNLRTGERASCRPRDLPGQAPNRFNWNTPFILSAHNPRIFYCGGNYVFRSLKQGTEARAISPDITRTKRGTATGLAESPRNAEVLWAGTDDGNLWVTRDGGVKWTNVADKVGLAGPRWVATIEASRAAEGRAYVAFDGHRSDDDAPYVYVTEDFGQTWKSLRGNLPTGSTRVLREDPENKDLLYLGTEFAAWASLDRGQSWTKINNNLPTVAVHEFGFPTTASEVVAATHGRSFWVLDVATLRQMTPDAQKAKVTLFRPAPAVRWRSEPTRGATGSNGSRYFVGENPARGAQIYYALGSKAEKVSLKVFDYAGQQVKELQVKTEPGLHHMTWDLTRGGRAVDQGGPRRGPGGPPAASGMYRIVLNVDGVEQSQGFSLEPDPVRPDAVIVADGDNDDDGDDDDKEEATSPLPPRQIQD